jgi:hypothetical protein
MKTWTIRVSWILCGIALGVFLDRAASHWIIRSVAAQQAAPPVRIETLAADLASLRTLLPSNSNIMMDVQFHWTNLWFAGQRRNWPLAQFYFNESRSHIQWLIRKSPVIKSQLDGKEVDVKGIFDGIDTSSLAEVKTAIEHKDLTRFTASYRTMLESCYACHKSVGRPYLRPQIPRTGAQSLLNFDPNAAWPQ